MSSSKGPEAFRTIGEVADELELPRHVLRFWETKFSQLRPVKRGSGRRLYRPQDVDLLRGIRQLLYDDGLTIKGVQKVMREHGLGYVMAVGRGEAQAIDPPPDIPEHAYPEIRDPQEVLPFPADEDGDAAASGVPPAARGRGGGARRAAPTHAEAELREVLADLHDLKKRLDEAR